MSAYKCTRYKHIINIITMKKIKLILIVIVLCAAALSAIDVENIFNRKAEDIFNEKVGDTIKKKEDLNFNLNNPQMMFDKLIQAGKPLNLNETEFEISDTTTEKNIIKLSTPQKNTDIQPHNITMDEVRWRMKQKEIDRLMSGTRTFIPSFLNDDDDPNQLTKHFDLNITIPSRRVYYHEKYGNSIPIRERQEKMRMTFLMIQFIYMTRRQMGYMTVLRKKYKDSYKYQIGYLFGLRRMVKVQQMMLYKTLKRYMGLYDNAQISLQMYYRIIMLAVDVHDIMRYIIKLNYKQNLAINPKYYMDSAEYFGGHNPLINPP